MYEMENAPSFSLLLYVPEAGVHSPGAGAGACNFGHSEPLPYAALDYRKAC